MLLLDKGTSSPGAGAGPVRFTAAVTVWPPSTEDEYAVIEDRVTICRALLEMMAV